MFAGLPDGLADCRQKAISTFRVQKKTFACKPVVNKLLTPQCVYALENFLGFRRVSAEIINLRARLSEHDPIKKQKRPSQMVGVILMLCHHRMVNLASNRFSLSMRKYLDAFCKLLPTGFNLGGNLRMEDFRLSRVAGAKGYLFLGFSDDLA